MLPFAHKLIRQTSWFSQWPPENRKFINSHILCVQGLGNQYSNIYKKYSPTHVPEESVIHGVQVLLYNLRCKGCVGGYRSPYLKTSFYY